MGDLTKNISRHELHCKCGACDVTIQDHEPVIQVVQRVCDTIQLAYPDHRIILAITSGARCYEYNRSSDFESNDDSQHPRCCAIDFKIYHERVGVRSQVSPDHIYDILDVWHHGGLGRYPDFNHVDCREYKARF